MFIFERLFALAVYVGVLLVVCLLLSQKNSNYKRILFGYTIILAIMGFFYMPYKTADLYRIYELLNNYSHYNWKQFYNIILDKNILEIDGIYYWLIAQTGEFRLLPAINAFLCYSCVFYIVVRMTKLYNINRSNIALALFFFMSIGGYIFAISGIRSMLGVCLLAFCFFRESVEKKFKVWHVLLYIIAVFIHNFTFILFFIRLGIPIITRKLSLSKKILRLFILAVSGILVLYFAPTYVREVINRSEEYVSNDMFSYKWNYVIGALTGVIIAITLYKMQKINIQKKRDLRETKVFIIICLCIAIVFSFEYSIFHRTLTYITPILALPLMLVTTQEQSASYRNALISLLCVLLIITCARGSLCSLKFFQF